MSRPPLYFLRHGETDWNVEGRLQGHTETALNANGRRQAALGAAALAQVAGPEALATLPFFASPMQRVRETVEILRAELGLPAQAYAADDRLREIAFGAWEGRTWREIRARDPIGARARDRDLWTYAPPGGESYEQVARRVQSWLDALEGPAVVVAHGGIGRVLMVLFGAPRLATLEAPVWQGRVLTLAHEDWRWLPQASHA